MKSRSSAVWAGVMWLLVFGAFAQEGEPEPGILNCRLTTNEDTDYFLPDIPAHVEETLTGTGVPVSVAPMQYVVVWVNPLRSNPSDEIQIFIDGTEVTTSPMPPSGGDWQALTPVEITAAATEPTIDIQIKTTLSTGPEPSLVLVGAVQVTDTPSIVNPSLSDTLVEFEYEPPAYTIPGYEPLGRINLDEHPDVKAAIDPLPLQNYIAVMGGISSDPPRLSFSWKYMEGTAAAEEGEGEAEGEPEGEGEGPAEGEPGPAMPPMLNLFWGENPLENILLTPGSGSDDCETVDRLLGAFTGEGEPAEPAGRPVVEVSLQQALPMGSRIIIDDFALTYDLPETYATAFPWLAARYTNAIENGSFEDGTDPFTIEAVDESLDCPFTIDDVRQEELPEFWEACDGDWAVVFELGEDILLAPVIESCIVDVGPDCKYVGKGEMLRVELKGRNLENIGELRMYTEKDWVSGNLEASPYIVLFGPPDDVSAAAEVEYTFRFNGPCNEDANGNLLCTDGSILGFYYTNGFSDALEPLTGCLTTCDEAFDPINNPIIVDTIPPVLRIPPVEGTNAKVSPSPKVSQYRVIPPGYAEQFPSFWVPQYDAITPKNAGSYLTEDLHVYLKSNLICPNTQEEILYVDLSIEFVDPPPACDGMTIDNVSLSGFKEYTKNIDATNLASYGPFPDTFDDDDHTGAARWTNGPVDIEVSGFYSTFPSPFLDPDGIVLTSNWQMEMKVDDSGQVNFKLDATDNAGNVLDTSQYNTIHLHWLRNPVATLKANYAAGQRVIDIPWDLQRPPLPGALPACAPLALFRVYSANQDGYLTLQGTSAWQAGPLRETTLIAGRPLRKVVDESLAAGNDVVIDVVGADEAGNIQCGASDAVQFLGDYGSNDIEYIPIPAEDEGTNPRPNEALDTAIRINLIHERYVGDANPPEAIRRYGGATRVALPPLAEACDTRVNAGLTFRANLPAAYRGTYRILWKLYEDGGLVARGVTNSVPFDPSDPFHAIQTANLMGLLLSCNQGYGPEGLADYDAGGTFIDEARSLNRNVYLAVPPSDGSLMQNGYGLVPCPVPALGADIEFYRRLGDEGNPPNPNNPNWPSERRREVYYTLTAQTIMDGTGEIDLTPASAGFSIYVREAEAVIRDETPVREFSR